MYIYIYIYTLELLRLIESMEHLPTSTEYELMKDIDFIVPLKQVMLSICSCICIQY